MDMEKARSHLIRQLSNEISDKKVLQAMAHVPRELFVPIASQHLVYENIPLPIDKGQTISQPYIVALMTEALKLTGQEKVLEVGTGSGYQTAILCKLARLVISVERHSELAEKARKLLILLKYTNAEVHVAGRSLGWSDEAPYDAIIVTAGAPNVPDELLKQLDIEGRMVIPVGTPFDQNLIQLIKKTDRVITNNLGACRFVPLIGDSAWVED
jgi:protein-L-isoaspartate(D-aspartate) O-methyltransferase